MSFCQRVVITATTSFCIFTFSLAIKTQPGFASVTPTSNLPDLLPLPEIKKLSDLQKAYLDSYTILSQNNSCSEFFGGPASISALNEFIEHLRPSHLDKQIGIRMTGETTLIINAATGLRYRLFKKAEINLDGPFYPGNTLPGYQFITSVGDFSANSREARVTVLLHELGHLIQKGNGDWLLPNDGHDFDVSRENTDRIIAVCGEQIRQLRKASFEDELIASQVLQAEPDFVNAQ